MGVERRTAFAVRLFSFAYTPVVVFLFDLAHTFDYNSGDGKTRKEN
jgi:hypothetical protein